MLTTIWSNNQRATQKTSKESHFGRQWGHNAGFLKRTGRPDYFFDDIDDGEPADGNNPGDESGQKRPPEAKIAAFISGLRDQSLNFIAQQRGLRLQQLEKIAAYNKSMTRRISHMYEVLSLCATELNCQLGQSEMTMIATEPQHVTETLGFSNSKQSLKTVTYYRARLASPTMSLILRGKENAIDIFIMPAQSVLGFSAAESAHEPLIQLVASMQDNKVVWHCGDKEVSGADEEELCLSLFELLLDATRESTESADESAA